MNTQEAMEMKATLESKGEVEFYVCTLEKYVSIKNNLVSIDLEKKKEFQRIFTPAVIEPSFGIGRIMYCLYEHCFSTRPDKSGAMCSFAPAVAPIKCFLLPSAPEEHVAAKNLSKELLSLGIYNRTDSMCF